MNTSANFAWQCFIQLNGFDYTIPNVIRFKSEPINDDMFMKINPDFCYFFQPLLMISQYLMYTPVSRKTVRSVQVFSPGPERRPEIQDKIVFYNIL